MKIFDKARCNSTGMQQPFGWKPVEVQERTTEVSHGHGPYGNQTGFCLEVLIGCQFFANQAQYPEARKNAEQIISREFFHEALKWIAYAKRGVMECDGEAAMHALSELEREILG